MHKLRRMLVFLPFLVLFPQQGVGHFTVEIAIYSWLNPASGNSVHGCCDNDPMFYPQCNDSCETTLVFCLQPFQSPSSDESCSYGMFRSPFDNLIANPDNITFTVGQSLEGNVPNPMTFYVPNDLSVGARFVLKVSDLDDLYDRLTDDDIDTIAVPLDTSMIGSTLTTPTTYVGQNGVGTAELTFRVQCAEDYCGSDCSQFCGEDISIATPCDCPKVPNCSSTPAVCNCLQDQCALTTPATEGCPSTAGSGVLISLLAVVIGVCLLMCFVLVAIVVIVWKKAAHKSDPVAHCTNYHTHDPQPPAVVMAKDTLHSSVILTSSFPREEEFEKSNVDDPTYSTAEDLLENYSYQHSYGTDSNPAYGCNESINMTSNKK